MSLLKKLLQASTGICAYLLIAGCGDVLNAVNSGGSSNTNEGGNGDIGRTPLATGSVAGVAMNGLLTSSDVRIFSFDGTKGSMLAAGQTDAQGRYRIDLTVRSQPILIEVSGGR